MYSRLLLTVDLNNQASWAKALPEALELARINGSELHVMAVVPTTGMPLVAGFFPPGFEETAVREADTALTDLLAREAPGAAIAGMHLAHGEVHEEILKTIGTLKPDLVVMASHAPEGIREFLVGSNADRVVRRSPVSVLVVRG